MERTRIGKKLSKGISKRVGTVTCVRFDRLRTDLVQPGQTQFEFQAAKQHTNSFDCSMVAFCALADSAMATAYATTWTGRQVYYRGIEVTFCRSKLKPGYRQGCGPGSDYCSDTV
jgi:hypothetical protein